MLRYVTAAICCAAAATARASPVKPDIEVVLSHFNEDMRWADEMRAHPSPELAHAKWTVYSKGPVKPDGAIPLPNVGREGHTFLQHIVTHYDSLADWTVFSQATAPTWADYGNQFGRGNGHMSGTTTFEDYMTPRDDSFFVMSNALNIAVDIIQVG